MLLHQGQVRLGGSREGLRGERGGGRRWDPENGCLRGTASAYLSPTTNHVCSDCAWWA